jgi:hypothetical protein
MLMHDLADRFEELDKSCQTQQAGQKTSRGGSQGLGNAFVQWISMQGFGAEL